ncbi:MAG: hypothetical protein NZ700_13250, partial [Gemmataceae bacterium]|nr:hypothetical protein [Gemmataceae bacterium]
MLPNRYQLLAQLGAGRDGTAYRALDRLTDRPVELWILNRTPDDPWRWPSVRKRLRLAKALDHPTARRVFEAFLDEQPPWLVLETWDASTLEETCAAARPAADEALRLGWELIDALAAAHRLGLAHGGLSPRRVWRPISGGLKLDFAGLDVLGQPNLAVDFAHPADDLSAWAKLVAWLLSRPTEGAVGGAGAGAERGPTRGSVPDPAQVEALEELLGECLSPARADRPSAAEARERLAAILRPLEAA